MELETNPTPDGFAISHEEIVERLRDMAFRFSEAIAQDDDEMRVEVADIETLNLAISALGGKPVRLEEAVSEEIPY